MELYFVTLKDGREFAVKASCFSCAIASGNELGDVKRVKDVKQYMKTEVLVIKTKRFTLNNKARNVINKARANQSEAV